MVEGATPKRSAAHASTLTTAVSWAEGMPWTSKLPRHITVRWPVGSYVVAVLGTALKGRPR